MWQKLVAALVLLQLLSSYLPSGWQAAGISVNTVLQKPHKDGEADDTLHLAGTAFDYDYAQDSRSSGGYRRHWKLLPARVRQASTTTERPLIRVWNSIVRSVQPALNFRNLTLVNPLANFFNDGNANIIETPPVEEGYQEQAQAELLDYVSNTAERRRKKKRKEQRRRRPGYDSDYIQSPSYAQDDPSEAGEQYGYYSQSRPSPMFYYDTNSGNFYGVQRLGPHIYPNHGNFFGNYYPSPALNRWHNYGGYQANSLGKLNTKKLAVLRPYASGKPLKWTTQLINERPAETESNKEDELQTADNEMHDSSVAHENTDENNESDDGDDDDKDESDADTDDFDMAPEVSESMRNTLGKYLLDYKYKQSSIPLTRNSNEMTSHSNRTPMHQRRKRVFWLRAW